MPDAARRYVPRFCRPRSKFDHYCPLVFNAVGEDNQAHFVLFCFTMLAGQALFLRLGTAYLALHGEGVWSVLRHRFGRGWVAHPVVMLNVCIQLAAFCFNSMLCARAAYGIAAELTSNEMANTGRYAYLHHPTTGEYDNPFDAGIAANAARFFAGLWGAPPPDWDALADAVRDGKAKPPPRLSMAVLFRLLERAGWMRKRGAHGHSHGGQECGHDHGGGGGGGGGSSGGGGGGHGHSHGGQECGHDHGSSGGSDPAHGGLPTHVRTRDGVIPISQLPVEVQEQLTARLLALQAVQAAQAAGGATGAHAV
jgi:uncharacterized membrane protein YgcG